MWEPILIGVILLLIGGVPALAKTDYAFYKEKVMIPLLLVVWAIFTPILIWTFGAYFAYESLKDHVDVSKGKQALETLNWWRVQFRFLFGIPLFSTLYVLATGVFFGKLNTYNETRRNRDAIERMARDYELFERKKRSSRRQE